MARPAQRFNPRDPREWVEDTRRRRDGRREIEAQLQEMDETQTDAMEELEAIYAELQDDMQQIYSMRDMIWRDED